MKIVKYTGLNAEQSSNTFSDKDLESMAHGNNPQSNAYRELLARRCQQTDYQPAIDILRERAARELDGGFRAHHNALIYAANELENAQAFGRESSHES